MLLRLFGWEPPEFTDTPKLIFLEITLVRAKLDGRLNLQCIHGSFIIYLFISSPLPFPRPPALPASTNFAQCLSSQRQRIGLGCNRCVAFARLYQCPKSRDPISARLTASMIANRCRVIFNLERWRLSEWGGEAEEEEGRRRGRGGGLSRRCGRIRVERLFDCLASFR